MILSAQTIRELCLLGMITPFHERTVMNGKSFGLSCATYDIRIKQGKTIYPNEFVLASAIECMNIPPQILVTLHDKSSWARKGIAIQNTVFDPGFRGYPTLEITNHSNKPVHISAGDPIGQIMFHVLDRATDQPYQGKYQDQPDYPVEAKQET